ncbi:hypothetical protein J3P71_03950 [Rhizobium leguminosarum]|uniref:hypothetical protein n=1 Tax=Rhizobium leguminosarum TaxID=384 RepID=UPI0014423672|nr:hypothetical protein [Rhizobium leguminosarum]MBY5841417.1 hypothetical protein [Rhizobium leguminosarum]NKM81412.1 hypothetical protein [Rhizobium leguminosarum bv. viciae]QSZ08940.1 hypothetical protein J3P71_03950 [Rhizobium leguminosarum]
MAKRKSGDMGFGRVTVTPEEAKFEYASTKLPEVKEPLEAFYGDRFIAKFNEQRPLGDGVQIIVKKQNDTSDLDYEIDCQIADYLELAELTPLSEPWGRETFKTGSANIYEFGKWAWQSVIDAKAKKYGDISRQTILLLYATHWQFMANEGLLDLLRSTLQKQGNPFAAVAYIMVIGETESFISMIAPYGKRMRTPQHFRGQIQHNIDIATSTLKKDSRGAYLTVDL